MNTWRMERGVNAPSIESRGKLSGRMVYVNAEHTLLDLLDDLTGNTVTGYDAAHGTGGGKAVVTAESATPTAKRGSGNYVQSAFASEAGAHVDIVLANPMDLRKYEYMGVWLQTDTAFAAGNYRWDFFDKNGVAMGSVNLPAADASVWQRSQVSLAGIGRVAIKTIRLVDVAGDDDVVDLEYLDAYDISNGKGPVRGLCVAHPVETGTLTQGMGVSRVIGKETIVEAPNNSALGFGVVVEGAAAPNEAIIQETGLLYMRCLGTTVLAGDPVSPTATSKAFDDDTGTAQKMGTWLEASGATLADLLVDLGR